MRCDEFEEYWKALEQIEAQEVLMELKIADWPNMKKEDRSKWHRQLHKLGHPEVHSKKISLDELRGMLNGG